MRKISVKPTRRLKVNQSFEGETIETQLKRMMDGETIETKGKPLLYTEKKDGVLPETNIRSDRFQLAQDAIDYVNRSNIAKRDEFAKQTEEKTNQGTENQITGKTTEGTE